MAKPIIILELHSPALFNYPRTLKFKGKVAITFSTAVNHYYRNRHLKAETNKMGQNPPITTQEHEPSEISRLFPGRSAT